MNYLQPSQHTTYEYLLTHIHDRVVEVQNLNDECSADVFTLRKVKFSLPTQRYELRLEPQWHERQESQFVFCDRFTSGVGRHMLST